MSQTEHKSLQTSKITHIVLLHLQALMNSLGQLSRSYGASFLTFAVIGIALALPMGMNVLLKNFQMVADNLHDSGQISLYTKVDTSQHQIDNELRLLKLDKDIKTVKYISPQQGLNEFALNAGFTDILKGLKTNPLPGVFVVAPEEHLKPFQIQALFTRLKRLPAVESAELDMQWLKRFNAIIAVGHRAATLLLILFAIGVLLIIGNTVRLTTQSHQQEIRVIKLIGGTESFIRRPFLYSGAIYGFAGGILAWFIVDIALWFLDTPIAQLVGLYGNQLHIDDLGLSPTLFLLIGGALLGWFASWLTVSRYIKKIDIAH